MGEVVAFLRSSAGKKAVMAATGLALWGFLAGHLAGNLQIVSAVRFNAYAHLLTSTPLIYPVEAGLVGVFAAHVAAAILVWLEGRRARPVGYAVTAGAGGASRRSLASSTMIWSGAAVVLFVCVHVVQFKYGPGAAEGYAAAAGGAEVRDVHRLVVETFRDPRWAAAYAAAMAVLGLHLWHCLSSAAQTLGIFLPRYETPLLWAARAAGLAVAAGFLALPLLVLAGAIP